ncbi:MAG: ketoacyl-ACP synthase III [Candidatus Omnitrophica bacterium]|nr:ketoacyl-ACP synthase III [Candidatus Omnitrophota bacterium]
MKRARIIGLGHYVPPKVVTNEDLAKVMDTSDAWIRERTGIQKRHFVEDGMGTADLAFEATKKALQDSKKEAKEIDFIILATLSPDYFFPGSGVLLQEKLGIDSIGALDIRTQCTGFIYGLSIADTMIRAGQYERVLLVGSEVHSTALDLSTRGRDVAVLFGDGAGAALLEATEGDQGVLSTHLHAEGRYAKELWVEAPGSLNPVPILNLEECRHFPKMNGREVFKHAVTRFIKVIQEALEANHVTKEEMDLLVVHQANLRIAEAVREYLRLPPEKMYNNIQRYGNTTAASIPMALSEAKAEGKLKEGDLVCLAAFGSGFTWGSALIRW